MTSEVVEAFSWHVFLRITKVDDCLAWEAGFDVGVSFVPFFRQLIEKSECLFWMRGNSSFNVHVC